VRWSLQRQIFVPFSVLVLSAVSITALVSAVEAARRSNADNAQQLRSLVQALSGSNFPYTPSVLSKMKGLARSEFAVVDRMGNVHAATFDETPQQLAVPAAIPSVATAQRITDFPRITVAGHRYFVAATPDGGAIPARLGGGRLFVFYPEEHWLRSRWHAIWPPLLIGALAGIVALGISGWLAHRFASRIQRVQEQLRQLAAQQYVQTEIAPPFDELYALQSSANQLASRLAALQAEIVHTERVRLLAQIAGGLAHQLRNAVTGARMAVELHARRCPAQGHDTTLDVALRQLSLTEEQIKGLLALGARRPQELRGGDLRQIVASIGTLVEPICSHVQVTFTSSAELPHDAAQVRDADSLRAALLNLVLNGIEAAGPGGEVALEVAAQDADMVASVYDSGPGPPPTTQQSLFEPFVTSKPEGVGLGLTLAQHTAQHYGGSLAWERVDGRTVFRMRWPRTAPIEEPKTEWSARETTAPTAAKGIPS
jgi:signal transduction histidine kinase